MQPIKGQNHPFHNSTVDRLLAFFVIALYKSDNSDLEALHQKVKYKPALFVRRCADGEFDPVDNAIQRQINELCPTSTKMRLYIESSFTDIPIYSIVIEKDMGLWRIASRRVNLVKKNITKDGIIVSWPRVKAEGFVPSFRRILVGSKVLNNIETALAGNEEMRLRLTHCILAARLLTTSYTKSIPIYYAKKCGRLVLEATETSNPLIEPFTFKKAAYRASSKLPSKFKAAIICDEPDGDCNLPYSFSVRVSRPASYDLSENPILDEVLDYLINHRIVPFVTIQREDRSIMCYGQHGTDIVPYGEAGVQWLESTPAAREEAVGTTYRYTPNRALVEVLHHFLKNPQKGMVIETLINKRFKARKTDTVADFFEEML